MANQIDAEFRKNVFVLAQFTRLFTFSDHFHTIEGSNSVFCYLPLQNLEKTRS